MILTPTLEPHWAQLIPLDQWSVYDRAIHHFNARHISFALGGGLAFSHYANRWRNTKDIDLYILPADRENAIEALHATGLTDYFDTLPYDRKWIYRSHNGHGIIIDIIWQMANYRAQCESAWLRAGPQLSIHGTTVRLLAPEELIWNKLYVIQKDRCDWGDLLNILSEQYAELDWQRLLTNVADDRPVVAALLQLFAWACPAKAAAIPMNVWNTLGMPPPAESRLAPPVDHDRIRMLDSRDWFGPTT